MQRLGRSCRWMLVVLSCAAPASAQNVALRGPAPVPPGIDAPARPLSTTAHLRPPHETPAPPDSGGTTGRPVRASLADVRPTAGPPLPLLGSFEGAEYDRHSLDFEVAAGPRHVIVATNDAIALKEKNGTAVASRPGMSAFFDSVRQPQEFVGDPRVVFDVATERFFVAAIGVRPGRCEPGACVAHFFIAVSKRSAPGGLDVSDWHFYALDSTLDGSTPTARWADFVQLGLNDTVVVLTARMHAFGGGSPSLSKIRILDKAALGRGEAVSWTDFVDVRDPASGLTGFAPAVHLDRTERFFLVKGCYDTDPSAVTVLEIQDALSSPTLSFQSIPMNACQRGMSVAAPQPDGRPLFPGGPGTVLYRNKSLWNVEVTTVDAGDTDVNGVLWYQIDVGAWPAAATIIQASVLAESTSHYFLPALTVDEADNVAMVLGRSSAAEGVSLYYTGRLAGDPAGSLRTPALLKGGTGGLTVDEDRVGDYHGAALDASDGSAWLVGQVASGSAETASWVGRVGLPGFAGRRLLPDQSLHSPSGRMRLVYQSDGDLVLYDDDRQERLWSTGTGGTPPGHAILQLDGNLVVYQRDGSARWSSGTSGNRNARLVVQDDGRLAIVSWDGRTVWLGDRR